LTPLLSIAIRAVFVYSLAASPFSQGTGGGPGEFDRDRSVAQASGPQEIYRRPIRETAL